MDPVQLRDLVISDPAALKGWSPVVDNIVKSPADVLRIKKFINDANYEEAVLMTLQLFSEKRGNLADLLRVLRERGLFKLADTIVKAPEEADEKEGSQNEPQRELQMVQRPFRKSVIWMVALCWTCLVLYITFILADPLCDSIVPAPSANIISVTGLGGIGKSALVRKYAFKYGKFYDWNVVWINGETLESIRASFLRLAKQLGFKVDDKTSNEELTRKVFEYFRNKKCLFIFDNVEDKAHFKQFQPKIMHPDGTMHQVLITSRRTDLTPLKESQLQLEVPTMDESVQLIRRQIPHTSPENAEKLAKKLQRLPLALQQAIAYIRVKYIEDDGAIAKYLQKFEEAEKDVLDDKRFQEDDDYTKTTFTTWKITLLKIQETDGVGGYLAIELIRVLAYLNPDLISVEFLQRILDNETEASLKLLERFSLVQLTKTKSVNIHRLVQHVIRLSLSSAEGRKSMEVVVFAIFKQFTKEEYTDLARECTSHGLHMFPFEAKHHELMKRTWIYLANLCQYLNRYSRHRASLLVSKQAASLYESTHSEDHESTITMKWKTAETYYQMNNDSEAMELLNSIFPVSESKLGREHPMTINIMYLVARVYSDQGDHEQAINIFDKVILKLERLYGEDNSIVMKFKFGKAITLQRQGKLDKALKLSKYAGTLPHHRRLLQQRPPSLAW